MIEGVKEAIIQKRFFSTTREFLSIRSGEEFVEKLRKKGCRIDDRKVLFITFRGGFDCNAKWICKELSKNPRYTLVWVYRKEAITGAEDFPANVILTRWGSKDFYRHLCTARVIIDNGVSTASLHYKKTDRQVLVETWHGSLGIKKFSPGCMKNKVWVQNAFKEAQMTDFIISGSTFENDIYREDYWKKNEIWLLGHARNDVLFYDKTNPDEYGRIKNKIYSMYGLENNVKICLYGPTFRDNGNNGQYDIPYAKLASALEKRFSGKWVIFTRFHSKSARLMKNIKFPDMVINVSDYPDVQELAAVCQCGITDYSSWITEYIHTKRPGFIFASDLVEYKDNSRALFFSLEELPFPLAQTGDELIEKILNFNQSVFMDRWKRFMSDKGCVDDGHASLRIAKKITQLLDY